jgi:hypothetical protein
MKMNIESMSDNLASKCNTGNYNCRETKRFSQWTFLFFICVDSENSDSKPDSEDNVDYKKLLKL